MLSSLSGSRPARPASRRLGVEVLETRDVPTTMFGLVGQRILVFDSATPQVILNTLPITGLLDSSERIKDIDVRPATGGLYGRSNLQRLYLINPLSGFALFVGPGSIGGTYAGIDFNAQDDGLREVNNAGVNKVINPQFGTIVSTDARLTYRVGDVHQGAVPRVTGIAYTNTFVFPPTPTLYGIDHRFNTLVVIGNPSDGQVTTVGRLGVNVSPRVGFDIVSTVADPTNPVNVAFASLQRPQQSFSRLYSIDLTTGAATLIGRIGNRRLVTDIAVDLRNTSGFVPPPGVRSSLVAGGETGDAGGVGVRMATPPVFLPPTTRTAVTPDSAAFAIGSESPGWFDHEPIRVG